MPLLALMEAERLHSAADVPTLIELRYPLSVSSIVYVCGQKGMPAPAAKRLIDAFAEVGRSSAYI